jgi:DNA polymerase-3 subunit chi
MTQIDFYTHVADRLRAACQISAKAVARGLRVTVLVPDAEAARRLDRMLWTTPAIGFVPHCPPDDPLAPVTPVILDCEGEADLHDQVLLNLRPVRPEGFARFRRLIEIVGLDEEDRAAARERYRFYRERGYEIRTHDLGKNREQ